MDKIYGNIDGIVPDCMISIKDSVTGKERIKRSEEVKCGGCPFNVIEQMTPFEFGLQGPKKERETIQRIANGECFVGSLGTKAYGACPTPDGLPVSKEWRPYWAPKLSPVSSPEKIKRPIQS